MDKTDSPASSQSQAAKDLVKVSTDPASKSEPQPDSPQPNGGPSDTQNPCESSSTAAVDADTEGDQKQPGDKNSELDSGQYTKIRGSAGVDEDQDFELDSGPDLRTRGSAGQDEVLDSELDSGFDARTRCSAGQDRVQLSSEEPDENFHSLSRGEESEFEVISSIEVARSKQSGAEDPDPGPSTDGTSMTSRMASAGRGTCLLTTFQ